MSHQEKNEGKMTSEHFTFCNDKLESKEPYQSNVHQHFLHVDTID